MTISIAIVVSEFNVDITYEMLEKARQYINKKDVELHYICYVPGSFDMPLMVEELLKKKDVDAVITLGAIIKGETNHDIIVAENVSRLIGDISLKYGKPVTLGITGPNMTYQQAKERISTVSTRAVDAAIQMVIRLKRIKDETYSFQKIVIIDS